jgi:hypothetical protein
MTHSSSETVITLDSYSTQNQPMFEGPVLTRYPRLFLSRHENNDVFF